MMHQEDNFSYLSNNTFEAVTLPYGNRTYNMTVLLPKEGVSIEEMMKQLDAHKIGSLYRDMEKCVVDLKLPKFTTSTEVVLNDAISKLGAHLSSQAQPTSRTCLTQASSYQRCCRRRR